MLSAVYDQNEQTLIQVKKDDLNNSSVLALLYVTNLQYSTTVEYKLSYIQLQSKDV